MKQHLKKLLNRYGIDIRRTGPRGTPGLPEFLAERRIETVLDVGANIGQFGTILRKQGYRGRIISFEPIRAVFETLKAVADRDGNWEAHNYAFGSASAVKNIQISENTEFSSLLDQTPAAQEFDPRAQVIRQEPVEVKRLDDEFASLRADRVFLKIDAQGYEWEILEGAPATLKLILGIQVELPLTHLYKGVWSLTEALEYLLQRGFILAQVRPVNYDNKDWVSMVEIDCMFRRLESKDCATQIGGRIGFHGVASSDRTNLV